MKRVIALIFALIICIPISGCAKPEESGEGGADYEIISVVMVRYNCASGNGYDKNVKESNEKWITRHNGFELGNLELYGCERTDSGYRIVNPNEFGVKYKVTQNLGALPINGNAEDSAKSFWVNGDDQSQAWGTDINSKIGVGACYVKIKYVNGTENSFSKTDFFLNAQNGSVIDAVTAADLTAGEDVAAIEVTLLYETYAGAPGILGIWWHEYANWRCEYTYNFQ